MKFSSTQVKGKGRGKLLGFPTINLEIPKNFDLEEGIYAVNFFAGDKKFLGAMHYGPIPTFDEKDKTLEVFLIDTKDEDIPSFENFEIETLKYLRPVMNFETEKDLKKQIAEDVENSKQISYS